MDFMNIAYRARSRAVWSDPLRTVKTLEGFSKKTRTTPPQKIRLAERRLADWRRRARVPS